MKKKETRRVWGLVLFFTLAVAGQCPAAGAEELTAEQTRRLQVCERLLDGVDKHGFKEKVRDLDNTRFPEENIKLIEAVAQTYAEIAQEQGIEKPETKEWLYSMVELNMGYLQLGGSKLNQVRDTALNKLIRRKLKERLPAELLANEEIFYTLDYLE